MRSRKEQTDWRKREGERERPRQGGEKAEEKGKQARNESGFLGQPLPQLGLYATRFTDNQFLKPPSYHERVNEHNAMDTLKDLGLQAQAESTVETISGTPASLG